MSRIFRKFRIINIEKTRFIKYFIYALGEILLIIIGILIALNLNNRSIDKEKQDKFGIALTQLYTNLYCEYAWYEFILLGLNKQRKIAEIELSGSHYIEGEEIPDVVLYLNSEFTDFKTSSPHLLDQLQSNITNNAQNSLVNQINIYYSLWNYWDAERAQLENKYLNDLLEKYDFPYYPRYDLYNDAFINNNHAFSIEEVEKAKEIRKDAQYQLKLKSIINNLNNLIFLIGYRLNETQALLENFQPFSPALNFQTIGIIGSSTKNGWEKSTPMKLVNKDKSIWKITTELKDGELKFRNGNSWNQNWGGTDEYDGNLLFHGTHIPIEKGIYDIQINIMDKKYTLKKIIRGKAGK